MSEPTTDRRPPLARIDRICPLLRGLAAAATGLGLLGSLVLLVEFTGPETDSFGLSQVFLVLAALVGGSAAGGLMLGLATLLELMYRNAHAVRRIDRFAESLHDKPATAEAAPTAELARWIGAELEQIRDVLLLDDEQKRTRRTAILENEKRSRSAEIAKLLLEPKWEAARAAAGGFLSAFPELPEAYRLRDRVEEEERRWRDGQADRLAEEAERAAREERWRDAYGKARELLDTFPSSTPADFARAGLETLRRNADIEQRRELEDRFKDLLAARRVKEALALAERIIREFPDSPQAAVLRDQLPKLRDQAVALGK